MCVRGVVYVCGGGRGRVLAVRTVTCVDADAWCLHISITFFVIDQVFAVVFDEFHYMNDPDRGTSIHS